MLSKSRKLSRNTIETVLKRGKRLDSSHFSLRATKTEDTGKVSFVVSKKVAKLATDRNKLKRRGFEALEEATDGQIPPYSLVFFAKKDADKISYKEIVSELKNLLKNLK